MADKAILFDSSRCSACQACVAACKGRFGLGALRVRFVGRDMRRRARSGERPCWTRRRPWPWRASSARWPMAGVVWEAARAGCVHCAQAPCAEVCPTGAVAVERRDGLCRRLDAERCVSCHLCAMVCPGCMPPAIGESAASCAFVRRVRGRGGRGGRARLRGRLPAGCSGLRRARCRGFPGQRARSGSARARLGQQLQCSV